MRAPICARSVVGLEPVPGDFVPINALSTIIHPKHVVSNPRHSVGVESALTSVMFQSSVDVRGRVHEYLSSDRLDCLTQIEGIQTQQLRCAALALPINAAMTCVKACSCCKLRRHQTVRKDVRLHSKSLAKHLPQCSCINGTLLLSKSPLRTCVPKKVHCSSVPPSCWSEFVFAHFCNEVIEYRCQM